MVINASKKECDEIISGKIKKSHNIAIDKNKSGKEITVMNKVFALKSGKKTYQIEISINLEDYYLDNKKTTTLASIIDNEYKIKRLNAKEHREIKTVKGYIEFLGFYKAINMKYKNKPIIIYPCKGIESLFNRKQSRVIENHIYKLYGKNKSTLANLGEYNIIILWNEGKDIMADVWIYDKIESWGSGPLVDVKIFRNFKIEKNTGVSAGNGLILLGKEEELRRSKKDVKEYLESNRQQLSKEYNMVPFYLEQ